MINDHHDRRTPPRGVHRATSADSRRAPHRPSKNQQLPPHNITDSSSFQRIYGRSDDQTRSKGNSGVHFRSSHEKYSVQKNSNRWRKNRRRGIVSALVAALFVIVLIIAGIIVYNIFSGNASHRSEAGIEITVQIPSGSSTQTIADILVSNEVIANRSSFISQVSSRDAALSLKAGSYKLTTYMDNDAVIDRLVAGPNFVGAKLTIPEGLTIAQTANIVQSVLGISATDFINLCHQADRYVGDYPFLAGVYDNSLEGFLYPKTYYISDGASADYVIRTLLSQFSTEMNNAGLSLNGNGQYSVFQLVTMGSIIERETGMDSARYNVASVIYNRLNRGMYLQMDPTVVYALGSSYDGHNLTLDDLAVNSPYNTYAHAGLPAGPICSPSILSIKAAYNPSTTNYLYYVTTELDGTLTFCDNYDDFLLAKERYKQVFGIATSS
jgi:UPF0755 protein